MMELFKIIFWISIGLIFHSYVLYPLIVGAVANSRRKPSVLEDAPDKAFVSILMAAFNEEDVIEEKIHSILNSRYDAKSYEILVGSDCSTDNTNEILEILSVSYPEVIRFFPFQVRQGKPNIINQLVTEARGSILVLTDANVIFDTQTLTELIKPFQDPRIGLVDSQMVNMGARAAGISLQEKAYISREVLIKYHESVAWGTMMGPFGGCFAIRKELYQPVPETYLVDDFFLNMLVLEQGFQAVNNPKALVFEDVSNDLLIEYRRKIRIATGNFQNLTRFRKLLWPPWIGLGFSFLSHKVIRWFGPILLMLSFISVTVLAPSSTFYLIGLIGYLLLLFILPVDYFLKKMSIHITFFRFITHFCAMNLAMLVGFVRYQKGVKSNVWQPTKRNQ